MNPHYLGYHSLAWNAAENENGRPFIARHGLTQPTPGVEGQFQTVARARLEEGRRGGSTTRPGKFFCRLHNCLTLYSQAHHDSNAARGLTQGNRIWNRQLASFQVSGDNGNGIFMGAGCQKPAAFH